MNIAEPVGALSLAGEGWSVVVLTAPPMIAPARQFVFPAMVAGEEDALARGALWLQVRVEGSGSWLAQCALGFAGAGVAHGLWALPGGEAFLACAGGYGYAVSAFRPEESVLLPPRPVVGVLALLARTVLVTHHGLFVRERNGEVWETPRLSWEGVSVSYAGESQVEGSGWNLPADREMSFSVDLVSRAAVGGGWLRDLEKR